jgi:hypothetical protein
VSLGEVSWLVVVAICLVATLILALDGYAGYSIVAGAVGLSASVNLL